MCSKLYDEAETKKPQSIAVFLSFNFLKHQQMHDYLLSQQTKINYSARYNLSLLAQFEDQRFPFWKHTEHDNI